MAKSTIVYAVDMLHYLPLFLAYEDNLPDAFTTELAPPPHGDVLAIERLMSNLYNDKAVDFCLCDPMMVNRPGTHGSTTDDSPVVIAQIVQRVPFWAVDHRNPQFQSELEFADCTQLMVYPEGTSGFVLGKTIERRCNA